MKKSVKERRNKILKVHKNSQTRKKQFKARKKILKQKERLETLFTIRTFSTRKILI